jgi:hypothetical protein
MISRRLNRSWNSETRKKLLRHKGFLNETAVNRFTPGWDEDETLKQVKWCRRDTLNLAAAQFAVAKAMCDGAISSEEAAHASSVLEQVGAAHERSDLEARIEALEAIKERSRWREAIWNGFRIAALS